MLTIRVWNNTCIQQVSRSPQSMVSKDQPNLVHFLLFPLLALRIAKDIDA